MKKFYSDEPIMPLPLSDLQYIDTTKQGVIRSIVEEMKKCDNIDDKLKMIDKIIEILKI